MFKVNDIVTVLFFIPGYPTGLSSDTRARVVEVRKRDKRLCVVRDDGREGAWWVDFDMIRKFGS